MSLPEQVPDDRESLPVPRRSPHDLSSLDEGLQLLWIGGEPGEVEEVQFARSKGLVACLPTDQVG
jgi:hypothetical protein